MSVGVVLLLKKDCGIVVVVGRLNLELVNVVVEDIIGVWVELLFGNVLLWVFVIGDCLFIEFMDGVGEILLFIWNWCEIGWVM